MVGIRLSPMKSILLNEGKGRTEVTLSAQSIGDDLVVCIFNDHGHLGAVAVADFCDAENRASCSVITRLGHKDDAVAYSAAHKLCKQLKAPVCAIAGIHLDDITKEEIAQIMLNCDALVEKFTQQLAASNEQRKDSKKNTKNAL
jgi:gallate decarboxylase subunit D